MMKTIRMLGRVFVEAGLGIWHSGWLNIVIVSILIANLVIFGIMLSFSVTLKKAAVALGNQTEFSVHLKQSTDLPSFTKRIEDIPEVVKIRIRTKEQNWREALKLLQLELDPSFNEMPNTLVVKVARTEDILPTIEHIYGFGYPEIEEIEYVPTIISQLHIIRNLLILLGVFIAFLLAIATFVINFNTIELVIRSRREELTLLNFMGVKNWFIKGPFIVQGLFYGLSSSLLSAIILLTIYSTIQGSWPEISPIMQVVFPDSNDLTQIICILTLVAVLVSALSSYWATEKRLQA